MPTDATSRQIEAMFSILNRRRAADAIPASGTLSRKLSCIMGVATDSETVKLIDAETLACFATASVEIWQRSVHSFLVSASLTKASPLWASVSGYYSSHYSIRAFAHLLGCFLMYSQKRIIQVEVNRNQYSCRSTPKSGVREHKFYWKAVNNHAWFANDPFFTKNEEGQERSDVGHRNKANYADHVGQFPAFQVLDEAYLKDRVEKIASIEFSDAPIPRPDSYPDTENVQVIAYHRMVKFRKCVDEILGGGNRFWSVHRKPGWCKDLLDFQVVAPKYTGAYGGNLP